MDAIGVMLDADDEIARAPHDYDDLWSELEWAPLAYDDSPGGIRASDQHAGGRPPMSKPANGDDSAAFNVSSRHTQFIDDLTGQPLSPDLCKKALAEELKYFDS